MIGDTKKYYGERFTKILRYFFPEFVTALLIYSLPLLLDAFFVGFLKSTPSYTVLGASNGLVRLLIKMAEAFAVGTLVLTGQYNGQGKFKRAGNVLQDAFWLTVIIGAVIAGILYFGAYWIYWWLGVSEELIYLGIPFLRLRAIGIFFTFVSFSIIGFLRGIKNTRVPMLIYVCGSIVFVLFDFVLIFGKLGLPAMGLYGSAVASIIQSVVMVVVAVVYVLYTPAVRQYAIQLKPHFPSIVYIKELLVLSWPVMVDKSILATAYIWLFKMISTMGTAASAAYNAVRDMEQFTFLPAVAFAQIITLLVSNDYGAGRWRDIRYNLYKVFFMAFSMVAVLLVIFSIYSTQIVQLFDKNNDFTELAARTFPLLSILVFFDVLQLILAGALRGAKDVRTVMMVRLIVCSVYFVPVSYMLSMLNVTDLTKLVLIYSSFYVGNMFMSIMYICRFRSGKWKNHPIQEN